jgi:peptidoglycan hydrolase CwlO-like protein
VTVPWRALAAGSETARRGVVSSARAVTPVLFSLGVAAMLSATLCGWVAPAAADSVSSLQNQAATLSREMILEQLQVDGFQQQRAADMADVAADNAELQQLQAQLDATRHRIVADLSDLRTAAVKAYVEGGTGADATNALFSSAPSDGASAVYTAVMTGDLSTAVDQLQTDRHALRTEESVQQGVAADAQRQLNGADAALAAARSTQQSLAQQQADVTGELAVAIAQQEAQDAAAARAAVSAGAPGGIAAATGAMPQLNAFLRCVVQAESGGNYRAISPTGQYMGAFQFSQPTWNEAARLAGMPTLAGVRPYDASPRDQDLLAIALYDADGEQPWYDPCRG